MAKARAVFLDRDGVISRSEVRGGKPYAPRTLETFRLLPRVAASVCSLKRAGFLVIVVTNQPDIGKDFQFEDHLAFHSGFSRLCEPGSLLR